MTKGFILTLAFLAALCVATGHSEDSGHVHWVEDSLKAMNSIKPGMTRFDLQKVFTTEGGISMRIQRTFVYRGCPYFKVDVEFEPDEATLQDESPKDKILRISKPYLDWS